MLLIEKYRSYNKNQSFKQRQYCSTFLMFQRQKSTALLQATPCLTPYTYSWVYLHPSKQKLLHPLWQNGGERLKEDTPPAMVNKQCGLPFPWQGLLKSLSQRVNRLWSLPCNYRGCSHLRVHFLQRIDLCARCWLSRYSVGIETQLTVCTVFGCLTFTSDRKKNWFSFTVEMSVVSPTLEMHVRNATDPLSQKKVVFTQIFCKSETHLKHPNYLT